MTIRYNWSSDAINIGTHSHAGRIGDGLAYDHICFKMRIALAMNHLLKKVKLTLPSSRRVSFVENHMIFEFNQPFPIASSRNWIGSVVSICTFSPKRKSSGNKINPHGLSLDEFEEEALKPEKSVGRKVYKAQLNNCDTIFECKQLLNKFLMSELGY